MKHDYGFIVLTTYNHLLRSLATLSQVTKKAYLTIFYDILNLCPRSISRFSGKLVSSAKIIVGAYENVKVGSKDGNV